MQPSAATTLRLPDFLGIGTQKGGTTSLQLWLAQHPEVFLPSSKEVQYFSLHADQPLSWYASHFSAAQPQQTLGEITPYYLFHPQAPQRIKCLLPGVKLVVLLRDPVERSLSHYFHARRLGFEQLGLQEALLKEQQRLAGAEQCLAQAGGSHFSHQKHSYLARSRYEQQLQRYEQLFKPEQLLVLRSEDLFQDQGPCWKTICTFLGVEPGPAPAPLVKANAGNGRGDAVAPATRTWLRQQLSSTYAQMSSRYGISWP